MKLFFFFFFHGVGLLALHPTTKARGPPLVRLLRLLTEYVRSCLPYLEDVSIEEALCRGDRDPRKTGSGDNDTVKLLPAKRE
jgi:hypothetical protein